MNNIKNIVINKFGNVIYRDLQKEAKKYKGYIFYYKLMEYSWIPINKIIPEKSQFTQSI